MENKSYKVGVYCRLSKDDPLASESTSIGTQRAMLLDYCTAQNYEVYKVYVDDGYSGLNFNRPGFQELLADVEKGTINMVITKDLSRLGRDYIMTGYYSEIYFESKGVRYIALADNFDSLKKDNGLAPFKNILNDMYARDLSNKIKSAKHQRAKQGLFVGSQTPYGYMKDPNIKSHLIPDPETAEAVRTIFALAGQGMGTVAIAKALKRMRIMAPSFYKHLCGDLRFSRYPAVMNEDPYAWCHSTVNKILNNPVYTGTLVSLKTETTDCKTKRRIAVPAEKQIITPEAHEAIITKEQFEKAKQARSNHVRLTNRHRENLFRGILFCECCGHPLAISKKQLKERTADMYLCMYHYSHPEVCPKTHRIYHDMLYPYVLKEIHAFARSMKRRKINSSLSDYADITELTPDVLHAVIERIEIGHVKYRSKPEAVIHIYWKLK